VGQFLTTETYDLELNRRRWGKRNGGGENSGVTSFDQTKATLGLFTEL